jgi:hypothetical protein
MGCSSSKASQTGAASKGVTEPVGANPEAVELVSLPPLFCGSPAPCSCFVLPHNHANIPTCVPTHRQLLCCRLYCLQLRNCWKKVEEDLDSNGAKFFLKVFKLAPPALALFPFKGSTRSPHPPSLLLHHHRPPRCLCLCHNLDIASHFFSASPSLPPPFISLALHFSSPSHPPSPSLSLILTHAPLGTVSDDPVLEESIGLRAHGRMVFRTIGQILWVCGSLLQYTMATARPRHGSSSSSPSSSSSS